MSFVPFPHLFSCVSSFDGARMCSPEVRKQRRLVISPLRIPQDRRCSITMLPIRHARYVVKVLLVIPPSPLCPPTTFSSPHLPSSVRSDLLILRQTCLSITPLGPEVNQYAHAGLLFPPVGSLFHFSLHSR